jgi:hypothetical protein
MRFVSAFRQAPERAIQTLRRFPVVLLAGAFVAAVIMADVDGAIGERLLMTALLGIVIAFDLTLARERLRLPELLAQGAVLLLTTGLLAAIYASIDLIGRDTYGTAGIADRFYAVAVDDPIRLGAIAIALHALAAVIPYLGRRSLTGFWDYNRTLFLRILSSALFSGFLFAGLSGALLAIDALLDIEVENSTYTDLFAMMLGVVTTWFFLAGVPAAQQPRESEEEAIAGTIYPRGLKAFVQFVLLPLTVVYLVILYLYTGKILLEWNLPEGQVSYLIFSYAVVGIFAYLLIYPLRDDEENRWIRTFARGFFLALAPLLIVLAVALMRRINDHGLTEPRYYGIALAVWLAAIVAYFLTRREDIRIIPVSLAIASLLTTFGPWGATSVAVRSQASQFAEIIARPKPFSDEQTTTVRSIAEFLAERGRLDAAARLVTHSPDTVTTPASLAAAAGVDPGWLGSENQNLHYTFGLAASTDVRGYSDMIEIAGYFDSLSAMSATLGSISLRWRQPGVLMVSARGESIVFRLDSVAAALNGPVVIADTALVPTEVDAGGPELVPAPEGSRRDGPHVDPPMIVRAGPTLRARLILRWLSGSRRSDSTATANDFSGLLLIGE